MSVNTGMPTAEFITVLRARVRQLQGDKDTASRAVVGYEERRRGSPNQATREAFDREVIRVVAPLVASMLRAKRRLENVTGVSSSVRPRMSAAEQATSEPLMTTARVLLRESQAVFSRWAGSPAFRHDTTNASWWDRATGSIGVATTEAVRATTATIESIKQGMPSGDGEPSAEPAPPEDNGEGLNTTLLIVGAASVLILGGGLAFGLMSRKKAAMQRGVKNPKSRLRRKLRAHHRALLKR